MPVNTLHPDYLAFQDKWQRCRDAYDGGDAVKARTTTYLPQPSALDEADYKSYLTRAVWYNATARTIAGLLGCVFRKPPEIECPAAIKEHLEDITLDGVPLESFVKDLFLDVLRTGRYGVLIDMPEPDEAGRVEADARPFWRGITAERILNWQLRRVNGSIQTSLLVIGGTYLSIDPDDEFAEIERKEYRAYRLDESDLYRVEIWREVVTQAGITELAKVQEYYPTIRGQRLNFIPFQFFAASSLLPAVEKPPLLDLIDINISHYQSSADLEHARYWVGMSALFLAGFDPEKEIKFGPSNALVTKDPNAKAEVIGGRAESCSALERALDQKEQMMAAIGARLLEPSKRQAEAAETLRIRQSGEQSVLMSMVATASLGLSNLLSWHSYWAGAGDVASVALNTDFFETEIDPQTAQSIMALWQSELISKRTAYAMLERGEMTRPGVDFDAEQVELESELPAEGLLPEADATGHVDEAERLLLARRVALEAGKEGDSAE